jgi:hypothetical protein
MRTLSDVCKDLLTTRASRATGTSYYFGCKIYYVSLPVATGIHFKTVKGGEYNPDGGIYTIPGSGVCVCACTYTNNHTIVQIIRLLPTYTHAAKHVRAFMMQGRNNNNDEDNDEEEDSIIQQCACCNNFENHSCFVWLV